jgi:hypothetical protein
MSTLAPARVTCNRGPAQTRKTSAKGDALGINAKYVRNPMESRVSRFALQSVSRSILPKSRTAKCLRIRAFNSQVQVWKSDEYQTASYAGLQTCGSVWACPVCSAKVAERRRAELQAAMASHRAGAGQVSLLTLTAPHQRVDKLSDLLDKQAKALGKFWRDRKVLEIRQEMGTIGQVRALEVTHGRLSPSNNGWHPHYHVLLFNGLNVDLSRFDAPQMKDWEVRLYLRWAACCVASGLGEPSYEHGLKLDDGTKAANYVSKWGLEDEMTKGHTKKARHGETPFDFLRAYQADNSDHQAAALFKEFAETFKGKRQLHWSHGLKAHFAIEDVSDDELANKAEETASLMGMLTVDEWRDVLKVDARATVLEIAARHDWPTVQRYLWLIKDAHKGVEFDTALLSEARTLFLTV